MGKIAPKLFENTTLCENATLCENTTLRNETTPCEKVVKKDKKHLNPSKSELEMLEFEELSEARDTQC